MNNHCKPGVAITSTDWFDRPEGGATGNQKFAIGDVHGRADLLEAMLDHIDTIPRRPANPRDIIFLGDLIDRGPEGLRAIDLAIDAENRCDRRVLLAGNHECMMWMALRDPADHLHWWLQNGGIALLNEIDPGSRRPVHALLAELADRLPDGFLDHIERGQHHLIEDDLVFVHAGIAPLEKRKQDFHMRRHIDDIDRLHWAWIREPFLDWRGGWDKDCSHRGATLVIHGHTVENRSAFSDAAHAAAHMNKAETHRRLSMDTGAVFRSHLACVEFLGSQFRFHMARAPWATPPIDFE